MRLFLTILLAVVVSAGVGMGVWTATSLWLPNYDDAASRGLGEAIRLFSTSAYVLLSAVLFGISARSKNPARVTWIAMLALIALPLLIPAAGLIVNGTHGNSDLRGEFYGGLQMFLPLWAVVVVQWLAMRWYIRGRAGSGSRAGQPG